MNQHHSDSSFGTSIIYEDRLPLSVAYYPTEPESGELLRVGVQNDDVLRMVLSLDEASAAGKTDEGEHSAEMQRLEFKVNLMMEMLGELYSQNMQFPDPVPVKLGAYSASWMVDESETLPAIGSYLALSVYLSRRYPRPLVLFAQVSNIIEVPVGGVVNPESFSPTMEAWIEADFLSMPQQTLDTLERFVFRQHRRFVAFSRRKS